MSIRINKETCVGCGKCVDICPGNLPALGDNRKAYLAYPKDCWGCMACVKECPVGAISYFLGADMGGRGATLQARQDGPYWHWDMTKPDGTTKRITVDSRESNKY